MNKKKIIRACAGMLLLLPCAAMATNGYFSHGYGIKAKGMGGVGIALPQDAMAAATNPAGMVEVGDRLDLGIDWFRPDRGASLMGTSLDGNGTKDFYIPEFGYNRKLSADTAIGLTVYGNGGMNTDYSTAPFQGMTGSPLTGVNLEQLFVAPTYSMKLDDVHSVGGSLIMAYQTFKGAGMGNAENSYGWGVRVGWTGKVANNVTLGATYASRTWMSRFKNYASLFAENGDFDIPSNYGVGLAFQPTSDLTLAADLQRINYSEVAAIANSGSASEAGFGWRDINIVKLGANYRYAEGLVLRAGINHGGQPIPASETVLNVLAPGVVKTHLTLGATWTLQSGDEVSLAYMHALKNTVYGDASTGNSNLYMSQDSLGIAYGHKF